MSQAQPPSPTPGDAVSKDLVADNVKFYDQFAATYDDQPGFPEFTRMHVARLRELYPFDPSTTTVLDFACGTGRVSLELVDHAKKIVGVDISPNMISKYGEKAAEHGAPAEKMAGVCAELKGEPGELAGEKFDVVICAMAYHHFTSLAAITRVLAAFLAPGGALFVVNFRKFAGPHPGEATSPEWFHRVVVHAQGIDEGEMAAAFDAAGLREQRFVELPLQMVRGKEMGFFISAARKDGKQ